MPRMPAPAVSLALILALAGCGKQGNAPDATEPQADPVVARALNAPLLTDPDLASQNRGDSAVDAGEPPVAEIPPDKRTPEEAATARAAAQQLAGQPNGALPEPPPPGGSDAASPALSAGSAAVLARTQLGISEPCAASIGYSAIWGARMPADLPVYPRAHLLEGAGTDGAGCSVRVLRFITPVGTQDVTAFYHAMASKAGYRLERRTAGSDDVLAGRKPGARMGLWVRRRADGMTEADLGISGG